MTLRTMMVAAAFGLGLAGCVAGGGGDGDGAGADGGAAGGQGGAGGDQPAPVQGSPIPSADSFRSQSTQLVCDGLAACCSEQGVSFSPAQCQALMASMGGAPDAAYDPDAAGDCVATLRTLDGCDVLRRAPAVCEQVFQGRAGLGEACSQDADCAPVAGGTVSCGIDDVCEAELRGAAGDGCAATCTLEADTGITTCHGNGAAGEPGEPRVQCFTNDGLFCGPDRTCAALVPEGGDCSGGLTCEAGLECRRGDGAAACAPLPALGEPCSAECAQGYCPDGGDAACTAFVEQGGACDPQSFTDPCGPGAACTEDGACEPASDDPTAFVCAILAGGGF